MTALSVVMLGRFAGVATADGSEASLRMLHPANPQL